MTSASTLAAPVEDSLEALLELRFPARADRLKLVRGGVRAAARMCGFNDATAQSIVLAVDEACQNVIVHGYKGRADGEIVLGVFRRRDGILVRLRDFAPPVDPAKIKPRALDDIRPGKLGSHFMYEIMDSVEYRPSPDGTGNLLEMIRRMDSSPW
ncbi:MAG: ATP-binding protein [Proteobacteria bacterium]|nr:ATP-binding protein [Pseudomonadota bacterium]MCH9011855.1 ATP-binding protein [Pseudomonadota bacterium]